MYCCHHKVYITIFAFFLLFRISKLHRHGLDLVRKGRTHILLLREKCSAFLCPMHPGTARRRCIENSWIHSYLLVSQRCTEMLLNVSLQDCVEMLEFPVCNESYYVDLKKRQQIISWRTNSEQQIIFTWHN